MFIHCYTLKVMSFSKVLFYANWHQALLAVSDLAAVLMLLFYIFNLLPVSLVVLELNSSFS